MRFNKWNWIVFLLLATSVLGCSAKAQATATAKAQREQNKQWVEILAPVCNGTPVAGTAAYSQTTGLHPTVWLRGRTTWTIADRDSPATWKPAAISDLELVACIQVDPVLIETCPYKLQNGRAVSVERYQYKTSVALREAQTARVIAETSWEGSEPTRCSTKTQFKENETVKKHYGVATSAGDIAEWMRPYVEMP